MKARILPVFALVLLAACPGGSQGDDEAPVDSTAGQATPAGQAVPGVPPATDSGVVVPSSSPAGDSAAADLSATGSVGTSSDKQ
jgi:hypothetical protein